jgi:hypothetical protein
MATDKLDYRASVSLNKVKSVDGYLFADGGRVIGNIASAGVEFTVIARVFVVDLGGSLQNLGGLTFADALLGWRVMRDREICVHTST